MDKEQLLLLLISIYNFLNQICERVVGYSPRHGWGNKGGRDDEFNQSARRHRVLLRSVWAVEDDDQIVLDKHFALLHQSTESPVSAILKDERATLMGLTRTHAFFCVSDEDVYDLDRNPFLYMAQARVAKEIITISLENFVEMSKMAENPRPKMLLLNNTARCGSTLMTKMLDALDNVWAMSEPDFVNQFSFLNNDFSVKAEEVLRAGCILQCKKAINREGAKELNVIKTHSISVGIGPFAKRALPEMSQAFMFRGPLANIASLITVSRVNAKDGDYRRFWTKFLEVYVEQGTIPESNFKQELEVMVSHALSTNSEERAATVWWASNVLAFQEARTHLGIDIFAFTYEQILADPVGTIARLMKHCQVSDMFAKQATKAMDRDSQGNSFISKDKLKHVKRSVKFSREELDMMDDIFERLELPPIERFEELLK